MEEEAIPPTDTNHDDVLARHYRLSDQVVIDQLGESLVAVQLGTDKIFELNETATRLVDLLKEGRTGAEAAAVLASEYDATTDAVLQDVVHTIGTLIAESMIEPVPDDA